MVRRCCDIKARMSLLALKAVLARRSVVYRGIAPRVGQHSAAPSVCKAPASAAAAPTSHLTPRRQAAGRGFSNRRPRTTRPPPFSSDSIQPRWGVRLALVVEAPRITLVARGPGCNVKRVQRIAQAWPGSRDFAGEHRAAQWSRPLSCSIGKLGKSGTGAVMFGGIAEGAPDRSPSPRGRPAGIPVRDAAGSKQSRISESIAATATGQGASIASQIKQAHIVCAVRPSLWLRLLVCKRGGSGGFNSAAGGWS